MKKKILLFTAIAGMGYVTLTSSNAGGGIGQGADGTKATGTTNTCARGGCHSASALTTVTLELDSAGVPTTRYVAGMPYTIKITGTNTGSASLPKFGFQLTVVNATGAGTSSAVNAGTFSSTLPTNVRYTAKIPPVLNVNVVEHSSPITATTGSGGNGTTYVESIPWTAPATGTGSLVIYGCVNAVNNNGTESGDAYNAAAPLTITEKIPLSVSSVDQSMEIKSFPNPAANSMNLLINNAQAGNYSLEVYSLGGKIVASEHINVTSASQTIPINSSNWAAGTYMISVEKDGDRKVIAVVKQ
jgi:hypothetical protein